MQDEGESTHARWCMLDRCLDYWRKSIINEVFLEGVTIQNEEENELRVKCLPNRGRKEVTNLNATFFWKEPSPRKSH